MIIYFCEQCGARVPEKEIASGAARVLEEVRAVCTKCAGARPSGRATAHVAVPAGGVPPRRDSRAGAASASGLGARASPPSSRAAKAPQPADARAPSRPGFPKLWLYAGGGVIVLLLVAIVAVVVGRPAPSTKPETRRTDDASSRGKSVRPTTDTGTTAKTTATSTTGETPAKTTAEPPAKPAPPPTKTETEEYDPRAAVAASLLEQAKAYFKSNPDDPWGYKEKLEQLKASYARTPPAAEAERLLGEMKPLPAVEDRLESIPEAKDYQLVYDLNLARIGATITYDADRRDQIKGPFDRIAYLLELKPKSGGAQYLYVSMDAFTDDLGKIGVPTNASGARFQQNVTNMNVYSNVDGIVTGAGLEGGNIEFWPNNYGNRNSANVPNASSQTYDFGDEPSNPVDGYGSMQVHNHDAKQTLFAINHWRQGNGADLGIGNRSRDNPDWTFSGSAGSYRTKRLRVLVHCK